MYLRPYEESDFEAIYALDVLCFTSRFRFSRTMMKEVVTARDGLVLLACEHGQEEESLFGFCAGIFEQAEGERICYISTLDVSPEHRGKGVGRTLLRSLELQAGQAGATWMALHVHIANDNAVRLYTAMGYSRLRRERGFYGAGFDAWVYSKAIDLAPEALSSV